MPRFKSIQQRLSRLKKADQRWLLQQLTRQSPQLAQQLLGGGGTAQDADIRSCFSRLHQEPPLLIAAVLETLPTEQQQQFLAESNITAAIEKQLQQPLKKATQQLLSELWLAQQPSDFASFLESSDG
ncbi:MAG: hypothetical protein JJT82_06065 [Legionellaceae bacterium]|nr:hypothetical protein [Legionellaceae bacterium]